ncbi:MAG: phosphoenolpyruvate synthase [Bacteroidaceae bacterium]|nr:phosphoenolpyruvate synthase [Bacteroidaceae bacterium]
MQLKNTKFTELMQRRICNVLIVANPYDAFMLEDDGRVDEKIFQEYARLGLSFPPRFIQVSTEQEAETHLANGEIDLVICMPSRTAGDDNDVFDMARNIKTRYTAIPMVVLTPFSHGITARMQDIDLSIFEYVFCWLGNTDLLITIIKLIEDRMNLEHDISAGVQMIMLVEDNIRFYSSILPSLYKFVLHQSLEFATEALNTSLEKLRMRGRPKIVLARNYEEAWDIYSRFSNNALGIISDCKFPLHFVKGANPKDDEKDESAGFKLCQAIRANDPYIPLIIESSEIGNRDKAWQLGYHFIDKNSKKMEQDLRDVLRMYFGFGDFVFRDPKTHEEVLRVRNLRDLQNHIMTVPKESFLWHIRRNNVSRWLSSRALFGLSDIVKAMSLKSVQELDAHRRLIFEAIVAYRQMKNKGVVAVFQQDRFDQYSNFARIGEGSLGGKGRGLAFLDHIMQKHTEINSVAPVMIPKTVVLCTDVFDDFMDSNNLYQAALSDDYTDQQLLDRFVSCPLPQNLLNDLKVFLQVVKDPIAVRSSSLLEDAHYQPFAGVYSTYMIPSVESIEDRLHLLASAIKSVYASVYFKASKDYMTATQNVIDQEKMAVILQVVVGEKHGDRFYPVISGVARSINYYPIGEEKPEEGTVSLAFGLGKYIVDGGVALRVSPARPGHIMQMSDIDMALRDTQTHFLALDMSSTDLQFRTDEGFNLKRLPVKDAEQDDTLRYVCSTYMPQDQQIYDGYYEGRNRKIISFSGVLQNGVFPLPEVMQLVLRYGSEAMRRPVEIEFAVNLHSDRTGEFYLLQIRPMVDNRMSIGTDLATIPDSDCLLRSANAIGHDVSNDICDIIYVKTADYNPQDNPRIADEISQLNTKLLAEERHCIYIGPGRWGSSDPWLGIPVKWPNISAARVIVEAGLGNYQVDPSQGTHFFQNLTSLGVSYLTINAFKGEGLYDEDTLNALPALEETSHLRHVRLDKPLTVMVDGLHRQAVVMTQTTNS